MTLNDVRYLIALAVCAGSIAYFAIDEELEYEKEKRVTQADCQSQR